MNQKLTWFLLGALFASMFWVIVVIGLNEQLLQTFYGFVGHLRLLLRTWRRCVRHPVCPL